jgi:hypothetical protein
MTADAFERAYAERSGGWCISLNGLVPWGKVREELDLYEGLTNLHAVEHETHLVPTRSVDREAGDAGGELERSRRMPAFELYWDRGEDVGAVRLLLPPLQLDFMVPAVKSPDQQIHRGGRQCSGGSGEH